MPEFSGTLQNENRLPADLRRNFVREVVNSVRKITNHCLKKMFEEISQSIVRKYPNSFEDRIDRLRIGTGYDSLFKQFIARNENLNRPYMQQSAVAGSWREANQNSRNCGKNHSMSDLGPQNLLK